MVTVGILNTKVARRARAEQTFRQDPAMHLGLVNPFAVLPYCHTAIGLYNGEVPLLCVLYLWF